MAQLNAKAVLEIAQPADALFAVITDYAGRRRHIMPTAYHDYAVDSGEPVTKVRWVLHVGNHRRPYEMHVSRGPSERRVVERDIHSSFTTEWQVTSLGDGSRVTLASAWQQRSHGFSAMFERFFAPRSLARLHAETLQRLAAEPAGSTDAAAG
jgi:hypothetical protein